MFVEPAHAGEPSRCGHTPRVPCCLLAPALPGVALIASALDAHPSSAVVAGADDAPLVTGRANDSRSCALNTDWCRPLPRWRPHTTTSPDSARNKSRRVPPRLSARQSAPVKTRACQSVPRVAIQDQIQPACANRAQPLCGTRGAGPDGSGWYSLKAAGTDGGPPAQTDTHGPVGNGWHCWGRAAIWRHRMGRTGLIGTRGAARLGAGRADHH